MTNESIEERSKVLELESSKVKKKQEMVERFKKLMSSSDVENKYSADYTGRYGISLYGYWFLQKENPAASVLFDVLGHYRNLKEKAMNLETIRAIEQLELLPWSYINQMANRTMQKETYDKITNGTEPAIGGLIKKILWKRLFSSISIRNHSNSNNY